MLVRIRRGKYWVVTTYGKRELSCPRQSSCLNGPTRYSHGKQAGECYHHNTSARLLTVTLIDPSTNGNNLVLPLRNTFIQWTAPRVLA